MKGAWWGGRGTDSCGLIMIPSSAWPLWSVCGVCGGYLSDSQLCTLCANLFTMGLGALCDKVDVDRRTYMTGFHWLSDRLDTRTLPGVCSRKVADLRSFYGQISVLHYRSYWVDTGQSILRVYSHVAVFGFISVFFFFLWSQMAAVFKFKNCSIWTHPYQNH